MRQFVPTAGVSRGQSRVSPLPSATRNDLDAVTFKPLGKDEAMTWRQSFDANYTDGLVVVHKGQIVYERYAGALQPSGQHIAMSVTESFYGVMAATLIAEGRLDPDAPVSRYVPELKDSEFADATVRQVMDMRTGVKYVENNLDPSSEVYARVRAGALLPRPIGYQGPQNFFEFMQSIKKETEHGGPFVYKSVNTDVLGWVMRKVTGRTISELMSERIWSRMGMEQDAYFVVDPVGCEFGGGGLNSGLRDLARFGEMMRNDGHFNGQQIVPRTVRMKIGKVGKILTREARAKARPLLGSIADGVDPRSNSSMSDGPMPNGADPTLDEAGSDFAMAI